MGYLEITIMEDKMDNTIDDLGYEKIHDKSQGYELSLLEEIVHKINTGHYLDHGGEKAATHQLQALIVEALYDLYEYMGQFPDDLNLAVMEERIKLIESGE